MIILIFEYDPHDYCSYCFLFNNGKRLLSYQKCETSDDLGFIIDRIICSCDNKFRLLAVRDPETQEVNLLASLNSKGISGKPIVRFALADLLNNLKTEIDAVSGDADGSSDLLNRFIPKCHDIIYFGDCCIFSDQSVKKCNSALPPVSTDNNKSAIPIANKKKHTTELAKLFDILYKEIG